MSSSPHPEEHCELAASSDSVYARLPIELVLSFVEAAVVQHREDNLGWSLTLSLVCRAVRIVVLPIIYKVVFLDVFEGRGDAKLAFLVWLLNDPTAPPRRYIKHIIFRHDAELTDAQLFWSGRDKQYGPTEWMIEQLTVDQDEHAPHLYRAGLRPQTTFRIDCSAIRATYLPLGRLEDKIRQLIGWRPTRGHWYIWAKLTVHTQIENDGTTITHSVRTLKYRAILEELDPSTGGIVAAPGATGVLSLQLEDGDLFHHHPDILLNELAATFASDSNVRIVLACATDYRIAGKTVTDFIRAAVPERLPQKAVQGGIRVSYVAWTQTSTGSKGFGTIANAQRCGRDPWDMGHAIKS